MGRLCIKITDSTYKEHERRLKEQFLNALDNENIIAEILKEWTAYKDTSEVSSEQVLMFAQRSEVQWVHKEVLDNIRDTKEFNSVKRDRQKCSNKRQQKDKCNEKRIMENCRH